jgi:hypothetical protein
MIKRPHSNDIAAAVKAFFETGTSADSIANIQNYKKNYNWKTLANTIENLYDSL